MTPPEFLREVIRLYCALEEKYRAWARPAVAQLLATYYGTEREELIRASTCQ